MKSFTLAVLIFASAATAQTTPEREQKRAMLFGDNYSLSTVTVSSRGGFATLPTRQFVYNCPAWVLPEHRWYYPHCFMTKQQAFDEWNASFAHPMFAIPRCTIERTREELMVNC